MQEKTDNDNAIFWVEVDAIPADPDTIDIYVYYGKADATTTSDGDNTFAMFDHFEGVDIDHSKWREKRSDGSYSVASSILSVTGGAGFTWEDIVALEAWNFGFNYSYGFYFYFSSESDQVSIRTNDQLDNDTYIDGATDRMQIVARASKTYDIYNEGSKSDAVRTSTLTDWTIGEIHRVSNTSVKFIEDGAEKAEISTNVPQDDMGPGVCVKDDGNTVYVDFIWVRKYVNPEPAHGAWDSEEAGMLSKVKRFRRRRIG